MCWLFLRVEFVTNTTRKKGQHGPLTRVHAPLSLPLSSRVVSVSVHVGAFSLLFLSVNIGGAIAVYWGGAPICYVTHVSTDGRARHLAHLPENKHDQ